MDEGVFDLQDRLQKLVISLEGAIEAFRLLGERHADLDREVAKTTMAYIHAHPESSKMSSDKQEMAAASTQQEQADYFELRAIRIRVKVAEKVMEFYGTAISALQTISKMFTRV